MSALFCGRLGHGTVTIDLIDGYQHNLTPGGDLLFMILTGEKVARISVLDCIEEGARVDFGFGNYISDPDRVRGGAMISYDGNTDVLIDDSRVWSPERRVHKP